MLASTERKEYLRPDGSNSRSEIYTKVSVISSRNGIYQLVTNFNNINLLSCKKVPSFFAFWVFDCKVF
jgi:hypothetical protein